MSHSDPLYHVKFFEKFAGPVLATWRGEGVIRSSDVRFERNNWVRVQAARVGEGLVACRVRLVLWRDGEVRLKNG